MPDHHESFDSIATLVETLEVAQMMDLRVNVTPERPVVQAWPGDSMRVDTPKGHRPRWSTVTR